jgi:hypothetical protein
MQSCVDLLKATGFSGFPSYSLFICCYLENLDSCVCACERERERERERVEMTEEALIKTVEIDTQLLEVLNIDTIYIPSLSPIGFHAESQDAK